MLDLKLLQKDPETVAAALKARNSSISMDEFLDMDKRRRAALAEVESLKSRRNTESAEVARRKKAGEDTAELVAELGELSDKIKALDAEAEAIKEEVYQWMLSVPNIPDASVPVGKDETENVEVHRWGDQPKFSFPVKEHWELGAALGGLDFERAGKLAGSRFSVSRGAIARLERACSTSISTRRRRNSAIPKSCLPTWSTAPPCRAPDSFPNSRKIFSKFRAGIITSSPLPKCP